jgi:hypothetical protein
MANPLGGANGDPRVLTINMTNVYGGPPKGGGANRDPRAPTINAINVDGGPRSHRTRDSVGAHLCREARSRAIGHMAVHGYTSCYLS